MTKHWVSVSEYAESYSVNRKTVYKWARAGLVTLHRIIVPGGVKPIVRVENRPPTVTPQPEERTDAADADRRRGRRRAGGT
jgi:hypothetical protein